jgi:hypothetical protein
LKLTNDLNRQLSSAIRQLKKAAKWFADEPSVATMMPQRTNAGSQKLNSQS